MTVIISYVAGQWHIINGFLSLVLFIYFLFLYYYYFYSANKWFLVFPVPSSKIGFPLMWDVYAGIWCVGVYVANISTSYICKQCLPRSVGTTCPISRFGSNKVICGCTHTVNALAQMSLILYAIYY